MEETNSRRKIGLEDWGGSILLEAGYTSGRELGKALALGRELLAAGPMDVDELVGKIQAKIPLPEHVVLVENRPEPVAWSEALRPTGPEDDRNLMQVRAKMRELMKCPVLQAGAIMPDACPAGGGEASIPVGGAIVAKNALLPAAHSADIVCSMYATFFTSSRETADLMDSLEWSTRFGMGGRRPNEQVDHPVIYEPVWENRFLRGLQDYAIKHMADQGDGNHFAYLGRLNVANGLVHELERAGYESLARSLRGHDEVSVLVTHHGSRGLGAQVYKRGMDAAVKHTEHVATGVPAEASWLDMTTESGEEYWAALQYVSRWTLANHQSIHSRFIGRSGSIRLDSIGNEHNFVWRRDDLYYHGKGATPAWKDAEGRPLLGLIPLNMGAEILFVLGSDNEKFLSFAPHGAGRNHSRTEISRGFRDSDGELEPTKIKKTIEDATRGLDIRWYSKQPDITESPLGYKPAAQVKSQIGEFNLARVIGEIQPRGCIMAGAFPKPWETGFTTPKQRRQTQHQAERRRTKQELQNRNFDEE